jgi:hypothetical protein
VGCFANTEHPAQTCDPGLVNEVDTGATVTYAPGVDAGYYVAYSAGGHWHFEWTCDTKLSAYGCGFTGTITVDTPAGGVNATCVQCEVNQDALSVTPMGPSTEIAYDTITSTGVDGVDFYAVAGSTIQVDMRINGIYQDDLVFLPSGGGVANPTCMPIGLGPSRP